MDTITVNSIEYTLPETTCKVLIEDITRELASLQAQALAAYKDFSDNGLTVNTIEAEGFLRGIKTAEAHILEAIKWSCVEGE